MQAVARQTTRGLVKWKVHLDELGKVSQAGGVQQLLGGCAGHAEEQVLAERGPNAEQRIHAGLARQCLQDVGHVSEGH